VLRGIGFTAAAGGGGTGPEADLLGVAVAAVGALGAGD